MIEVKICGVKLGTAARRGDWAADNCVFYEFLPSAGVALPAMRDMTLDFIENTIEHWRDNHTHVATFDLLKTLNDPSTLHPSK